MEDFAAFVRARIRQEEELAAVHDCILHLGTTSIPYQRSGKEIWFPLQQAVDTFQGKIPRAQLETYLARGMSPDEASEFILEARNNNLRINDLMALAVTLNPALWAIHWTDAIVH